MAMEQQENLEYALYDVLDDICRCLDLRSLYHVALVSRSWSHVAMKELSKRRPGPVCRVLLPVLYTEDAPEFNWKQHFADEPDTFLMFCGPQARARPVLDLEFKGETDCRFVFSIENFMASVSTVMGSFYKRIPGRMINLGVDKVLVDIDGRVEEIRACKQGYGQTKSAVVSDCVVGLSLPNCEGFKIEVMECVSHEEPAQTFAEEMFEKLNEVVEGVENPIFLIFSRGGYSIGQRFMKMFGEKYSGNPVNLWGGTIADHIKRSDDGYPDYRGTHGLLAMLLHGPRLRAHCAVVPIDDDESIIKRLADFRASLKLRRRSVGLICGPRSSGTRTHRWTWDEGVDNDAKKYYTAEELMKMVVMRMKGIQFMGMFNNPDFHCYGCDHGSKSEDYAFEHKNALSIMVLTYD